MHRTRVYGCDRQYYIITEKINRTLIYIANVIKKQACLHITDLYLNPPSAFP